MGEGVIGVFWVEMGGFSTFLGFWGKASNFECTSRPVKVFEGATGFRVTTEGDGEEKTVIFDEFSLIR